MTSRQKVLGFKKAFFFLQNGVIEKYSKKEGGGPIQFVEVENLCQEILRLVTSRISCTLHMSNRQGVQKCKGNQYENCESLLINQLTQILQVRGFYKHFN